MNRRSFIKRFAVAAAAVALGANLLPGKASAEMPYRGFRFDVDPNPVRLKLDQKTLNEQFDPGHYRQHFYEIERAYAPLDPNRMVAVLYRR